MRKKTTKNNRVCILSHTCVIKKKKWEWNGDGESLVQQNGTTLWFIVSIISLNVHKKKKKIN